MRVLVTGGAGFIGSWIVDAYLAAGHEVTVVDDLSTGKRKHVHSSVRFHHLDIRDARLLNVFAQDQPEVVCHQAARISVREALEKPLLYAEVNVIGSLNLLECCRRHNVRKVIYASTGGAVYGEPRTLPVSEDHPINPLDPYGASKHHVEHYLQLYQANFGITYTVLRYPNVYGPRQNADGEAGVVAIFASEMLNGGQPVINGNGEQERDFVYVSDVAQANVLALEQGDGDVFNIGSGAGCSVNRIFELLASLSGYDGPIINGPSKQGEVFKIYLDAALARKGLGWMPKVTLEDGLALTLDYFRNQKHWEYPQQDY
jgi:UDP-glucose 4-epimerase